MRLTTVPTARKQGRSVEIRGTEQTDRAAEAPLAMGFVHPVASVHEPFGVAQGGCGGFNASTDGGDHRANGDKVFVAGDMRRRRSLVVWVIRAGRQAAREMDAYLMGSSALPQSMPAGTTGACGATE